MGKCHMGQLLIKMKGQFEISKEKVPKLLAHNSDWYE
jgi:hypothetical protein